MKIALIVCATDIDTKTSLINFKFGGFIRQKIKLDQNLLVYFMYVLFYLLDKMIF